MAMGPGVDAAPGAGAGDRADAAAAFPACMEEVVAGYRLLCGASVRAVTAPPGGSRLAADAAWLWDALDQGCVSARRAARDLGLLDGLRLDACGAAFESVGLPRPALMGADRRAARDRSGEAASAAAGAAGEGDAGLDGFNDARGRAAWACAPVR